MKNANNGVSFEITKKVCKQKRHELSELYEKMEAAGEKEGLLWAKSVSFEELAEMDLGFNKKYVAVRNMEDYDARKLIVDPKYGAYWLSVFGQYAVLEESSFCEPDYGPIYWVANSFIFGWYSAVNEYFTRLLNMITAQEEHELLEYFAKNEKHIIEVNLTDAETNALLNESRQLNKKVLAIRLRKLRG